jgi:hypothetical protein
MRQFGQIMRETGFDVTITKPPTLPGYRLEGCIMSQERGQWTREDVNSGFAT